MLKFFKIEFKQREKIPFSNILDILEYFGASVFVTIYTQNNIFIDSYFVFSFMEDLANHILQYVSMTIYSSYIILHYFSSPDVKANVHGSITIHLQSYINNSISINVYPQSSTYIHNHVSITSTPSLYPVFHITCKQT